MSSTSPSFEIAAAVEYLAAHLGIISNSSTTNALQHPKPLSNPSSFSLSLTSLLSAKYAAHWHPEEPERGSAYRALIRFPHSLDPLIQQAITQSNSALSPEQATLVLAKSMQSDRWTLWIDPGCVTIRLHEGNHHINNEQTSKMTGMAGLTLIWGNLPLQFIIHHPKEPGHNPITRSNTPYPSELPCTTQLISTTLVTSDELVDNCQAATVSPSKRSKAIAIVRPASASLDKAEMASLFRRPSTPPPRLPPLAFTIEESTSPYVPSFGNLSSTRSNCHTPTALASSPLAISGSLDSNSTTSDPFARPSSRSSTTSIGSNASCSMFSHSSNDSQSSSIGSYTTMASSAPSLATMTAYIAKATPHEMNQAALFTFPSTTGGLVVQPPHSAPTSPSKNTRRAPRHQQHQQQPGQQGHGHAHTLSNSSVISTSSSSSGTGTGGHSRSRHIRVNTSSGQVQDYSNGKVGVLGGGVLLGLGNTKSTVSSSSSTSSYSSSSSGTAVEKSKRPNHRPTSSSSSNSYNSISSSISSEGPGSQIRPRSKSRTSSATSGISGGQNSSWSAQQQHHYYQFQHPFPPVPTMAPHWMQGQA